MFGRISVAGRLQAARRLEGVDEAVASVRVLHGVDHDHGFGENLCNFRFVARGDKVIREGDPRVRR